MNFSVSQDIWKLFPGLLLVVAKAENLNNHDGNGAIYDELQSATESLKSNWSYAGGVNEHPHIAAWRDNLRRIGVNPNKFPCAIESLCRQVLKGRNLPDINPIVNFYNGLSLKYVVPVGGWSIDSDKEIYLRLTTDGETFTELGQNEPVPVAAGEITYATENHLVTRHFVWRQSEHAKITEKTNSAFLVAEILPEVGEVVARQVEEAFAADIARFFDVSVQTFILREGTSDWTI